MVKVCKWTEGSKIQLDGLKTGVVVCSWVLLGHVTSQSWSSLCVYITKLCKTKHLHLMAHHGLWALGVACSEVVVVDFAACGPPSW